MNLRHVEFLRLVVSQGGFSKAADAAGVSQVAVTLAMRSLEADLGFPLFERQGRRKLPTERAVAFARSSQDVTRALDRMVRAHSTRSKQASEHATFQVGVAPAAGLLYGPAIYKVLSQCAPRLTLRIVTGAAPDLLEQLQHNLLDAVIAPVPRKFRLGHLKQQIMYVGNPVIYARLGHPYSKATTLAEIANAHWVVAGVAGTPGNLVEEAFRVRRWAPPIVAVQCADYSMLLRLVADTDLLAVISNSALIQGRDSKAIQALEIRDGLPRYDVCLVWSDKSINAGTERGFQQVIAMLTGVGGKVRQGNERR